MTTLQTALQAEISDATFRNYVFSMTSTKLEGSDKQISFAQSIRSGDVNRYIPELKEAVSRLQFLAKEKDKAYLQMYYEKKIQPIIDKLEFYSKTSDSSIIISNR